jgi:hypothetical protein
MMQPLAPLHEIFAPAKRSNREGEGGLAVASPVAQAYSLCAFRFSLFVFRFSAFGGMVAPIAFPEA